MFKRRRLTKINRYHSNSTPSFYNQLLTGRFDEVNRVLTFESTSERILPSQLFVRDEWVRLEKRRDEAIIEDKSEFIITGTPGIGKSHFKFYLMWKWALTGKPFLYEKTHNRFCYHSPTEEKNSSFLPELRQYSDCAYFVDKPGQDPPDFSLMNHAKLTMLFSSPNLLQYKQTNKRSTCAFFIMNPYTEEDIFHSHQVIDEFKAYDLATVKQNMEYVGPIPRLVFRESLLQDSISKAFDQKGQHLIKSVKTVSELSEVSSYVDSDLLAHMFHEQEDPEFKDFFSLRVASPYIFDRFPLLKLQEKKYFQELLMFSDPNMQSYTGKWLEYRIRQSPAGLKNVDLQMVGLGGSQDYGEESIHGRLKREQKSIRFKDIKSLPPPSSPQPLVPEVLYFSDSLTQGGWDCFMISQDQSTLYFFQVTVSDTHPIKASFLKNTFQEVQTKMQQLKKLKGVKTKLTKLEVVFLTHEDVEHKLSKIQSLKEKTDNNLASLIDVGDGFDYRHLACNQWVLTLTSEQMGFKDEYTPRPKELTLESQASVLGVAYRKAALKRNEAEVGEGTGDLLERVRSLATNDQLMSLNKNGLKEACSLLGEMVDRIKRKLQ